MPLPELGLEPRNPGPPYPGAHLSPDWVMSRRQVSICTSSPRFMLHISMYSCRCRFMSFFAVASSSCTRGSNEELNLPVWHYPCHMGTLHTVPASPPEDTAYLLLQSGDTAQLHQPVIGRHPQLPTFLSLLGSIPTSPISLPTPIFPTMSFSYLYLVDGFLIFLFAALEERLCVLNHLLQTVILLLGEKRVP